MKKALTAGMMCVLLSACQTSYDDIVYEIENADTTTIAAATGGAIGAGLGAIIGSQSGDAGTGLLIGAAAGSGTGALVGNMFQQQEEQLKSQGEMIARNDRRLAAREREVDMLRDVQHDTPIIERTPSISGYQGSSHSPVNEYSPKAPADHGSLINEVPLPVKTFDNPEGEPRASIAPQMLNSEECKEAASEIAIAKQESESREQLFRYRRALRMCPHNADYHAELGKLYLGMNRIDDAKFEFNEALRLDPAHQGARVDLEQLNR